LSRTPTRLQAALAAMNATRLDDLDQGRAERMIADLIDKNGKTKARRCTRSGA
jgi:hypothetical protein